IEEHVARGGERRDLAIVEREGAAIAQSNEHVTAAADIPRLWIRDRESESGRDRGVDCIAPCTKNLEPRLARERTIARDHRMRRARRVVNRRERPRGG